MSLPKEPFLDLVPKSGWLADYVEWTMGSEAPAPFHFFMGAVVLGAVMGRKVWFNKGYYKVFPNIQVLLVGPTGRVRKTSAINLGLSILQRFNAPIISEKTTPEAFLESLDSEPPMVDNRVMVQRDSIAVVSAPELAVLLGKQRYNEGMISILTALFDSPDTWSYRTKGKGELKLKNVTLSAALASTPDWLITAIPQDAFGGGFMSRLLFVVQESTVRCYPIPEPPPNFDGLITELQKIASLSGEMQFTPEAMQWYVQWYAASRKDVPEDEKMAGYHERKPDHMIRLAINLALSEKAANIDIKHIVTSSKMLAFLERQMLLTFKWLGMRPAGLDHERIIRTLKAAGGMLNHDILLQKLVYFMNAQQFKNAIQFLTDANVVREYHDGGEHYYKLLQF